MLAAPLPPNEAGRLAALQRYCVLDSVAEPAFDRLIHVVQHVLGVPTALVSLVDADRQWFKARAGLDATETPRDISFCGHAVYLRQLLLVPDATQDPRFADNPLVTGEPGLRFYVGAPLITSDGHALGTLCAIDYVARPAPSAGQLEVLCKLADAVVAALELRAAAQALEAQAQLSHLLGQLAAIAHHACDVETALTPMLAELCGYTGAVAAHVYLRAEGAEAFVSSGIWYLAPHAQLGAFCAATPRAWTPAPDDDLPGCVWRDGDTAGIADFALRDGPRARQALAAGLRSGLAFPVMAGAAIYAIVECYREAPGPLTLSQQTAAGYAATQLGRLAERGRVERLKNEFVATVSHELRTPLTSIAGALELLDGGVFGGLSPKAQQMVHIAYGNSRRLVRLVNDILDIEKIESGCMEFAVAPQPLAPLIERAIADMAGFAQAAQVQLAVSSVVDAHAAVDADRLIQVLTNLLSNAVKFSPPGATVEVGLARRGGRLRLSVSDRGAGIPEAFRARIFGKFAQADGTDNRRVAGSGLGLAIVRHIVSALGGEVDFETECGRGTVFHVDLDERAAAAA
jgi:signal transduction histidine kinase